jgi:hypothetical protein
MRLGWTRWNRHFHVARRLQAGLLMVGAALVLAGLTHAAWVTVRHVKGAERAVVQVEGKDRAYWKLAAGSELSATVNGPAVLRVTGRSPWKSKFKDKPVTLAWSLDGKPGGTLSHPVKRSATVRLHPPKDDANIANPAKWPRLSGSFTDEIRIPFGTHKVALSVQEAPGDHVLLRLTRKAINPVPKGGTIDLLPTGHSRTRDVVVKDSRSTYQVLASGEDLSLDVTGPTMVKVISRLDWNTSMAGRQKYQLKVYEDGTLKSTWVLRGSHSGQAVYAGKDDSTPARGELVYIEVPAGRHSYKVKFQDSGREVNLRFLMPREALRNPGK